MIETTAECRPRVASAPLAPLAMAVAAGVVADRYTGGWPTTTWAVIALAGSALALVALVRRGGLSTFGVLLAWAALGGAWHHYRWFDERHDDLARWAAETPSPAWVRGVLLEVPGFRPGTRAGDPGSTRTVLELSDIRDGSLWRPVSGRVQVLVGGDRTDLHAGQAVAAAGALAAIARPLNPGELDYGQLLHAQGLRMRLTVDTPNGIWVDRETNEPARSLAAEANAGLARLLGAARAWSHTQLVERLESNIAPLAAALLLGRREAVEPNVNDAFARTGTTHLLAISGLHLQVLASVLWVGFRLLGLGRRQAFLSVCAVTVAYALLVGLVPSVVRSAAMTVMVCVGTMRDRCARPANTLALAAIVTMLLNPAHLFDTGCQLSFLAVGAILWGAVPSTSAVTQVWQRLWSFVRGSSEPLDELERRLRARSWWRGLAGKGAGAVVEGVVISTVVWLVAVPLVALRFHIVSPIGVLLNIPLVPITSLALLAAGMTLGLSAVWAPLGAPAAWACTRLLELTEYLVKWGAAQSWGHVFVPGPALGWVLAFYALLALLTVACVRGWRSRYWLTGLLGGATVVGVALALRPLAPGALEVEVLAVGHGLAVIVQNAEGRAMLYDCGRMGDPGVGRRLIAPALWARGLSRLDTVVLSHADSDHYNGLPDLLDRFSIGSLRVPFEFARAGNPGASRLLDKVRERGIPVEFLSAGDALSLGSSATLRALHPPRGWQPGGSDNDHSLVLDLRSGGHQLLLTGDLELTGLQHLTAEAKQTSPFDVVLAPHHGGSTASPEWFYEWARPGLVVVSQRKPLVGTRDFLGFLRALRVPVERTWQRGAITLRFDAGGVSSRGFLDPTPSLWQRAGLSPESTGWRGAVGAIAFAAGLVLCVVLAAIEWGAWVLVAPRRRLGFELEPAPWEQVNIHAADGAELAGAWLPAHEPNGRTVIVLHGFAEDRSGVRERAVALNERGWNVLLPDARGHGQSEGDRSSFGAREAGDLRAWADWLAARVGPQLELMAWGRSMGAAVALRAASEDSRIRALVLEAPYPDLELAVRGWLGRLRVPRKLAGPIVRRAAVLAGVPLHDPSPLVLAPKITIPVLIIHGAGDPVVPFPDAQRLARAFPAWAEVIEVPEARHGDVIDVGGPELLERAARFFERALLAPAKAN